ncbi:MAG: AraC family transcriptional regulator [Polyangiaceae bacterium]
MLAAHDLSREPSSPELRLVRPDGLPGCSVMSIDRSLRNWKCFQQTWDLCAVVSGEGSWRYRGGELTSHAGDLRWKEPGEMFRTLDVRAPMTLRVLQLDESEVERLLDGRPRTHFRARQSPLDRPRMQRLLARMDGLLHAPGRLEREELLLSIIEDYVYPNLEAPPRLPVARPSRAMRAAHEHIRAHYDEEIRLHTLASLAGVHEVYLVRCFRQTYGLTPHAFQIELRLDAARRALLDGLSCAAAAALVGFHDQSHMTRHFKRNLGVTPGRFASTR